MVGLGDKRPVAVKGGPFAFWLPAEVTDVIWFSKTEWEYQ
jgi:hypothetical protein